MLIEAASLSHPSLSVVKLKLNLPEVHSPLDLVLLYTMLYVPNIAEHILNCSNPWTVTVNALAWLAVAWACDTELRVRARRIVEDSVHPPSRD
jgi:hypothetical protein